MQAPATQTWLVPQEVPQAPQCVGSFWRSTQAARPPTPHEVSPLPQPRAQLEAAQAVPPLSSAHTLPHEPQWLGSLASLTQAPPQLTRGAGQALVHTPFTHALPPAQWVLQSLQNCGSVLGSTHACPPVTAQSSGVLVLQAASQDPLAHFGAPVLAPDTGCPHAMVQLPQWLASVCSSKQPAGQRSGRLGLSQAAAQVPAEHTGVALGMEVMQAVAHAPQCWASVSSFTQTPLQSVKPALQTMPHAEAEQVATPLAGTGHFIPHAPQLWVSVVSSTQAPLQAL